MRERKLERGVIIAEGGKIIHTLRRLTTTSSPGKIEKFHDRSFFNFGFCQLSFGLRVFAPAYIHLLGSTPSAGVDEIFRGKKLKQRPLNGVKRRN